MTHSTHSYLALCVACAALAGCTPELIHEPLANAQHRATPLSFGLKVSPDPAENPIDPPERFAGYHAALDLEVSQGEVDGDVPVYAICTGRVIYSGYAEGYGGLLVHRCKINKQDVTVLYGHLDPGNLPGESETVRAGQTIGVLAPPKSYESGMNRKHLHLGIHKGKNLDLRGYVQTEEELDAYIDPATLLPNFFLDLPGASPGEVPYWEIEEESEEE